MGPNQTDKVCSVSCRAKESIKKMKRQPIEREKIVAKDATDKALNPKKNTTYSSTAKKTKKKTKRQLTEWEKIISNDATDKGLISKICKQLI